ncbi:MAG TPA: ATP-binding protein [Desulfuromonadaceae bacterium]
MAHMKAESPNAHGFHLNANGTIACIPLSIPLNRGGGVHEWRIASPDDKERVIVLLEQLLEGNDEAHDFLRQRAALMVDEMLENALYAAPRDAEGRQIFPKGDRRGMLPGERITLRCSFDGERLALEVSDSWGSLSPETVRRFIALNLASEGAECDRAGRGLFFMWRFMDDFYVSVTPGEETAIGGAIPLHPSTHVQGVNHGTIVQD